MKEPLYCDLCGADVDPDEFNEAAFEASGMNVCTQCLEAMLEAPAPITCQIGMSHASH